MSGTATNQRPAVRATTVRRLDLARAQGKLATKIVQQKVL
jgi:hypothetical protein